jgi:hypothetical protein
VDVEGIYNKVQHAVHATAVKERPTNKAESVGQTSKSVLKSKKYKEIIYALSLPLSAA